MADFDFTSAASQRLVSALRGDRKLKGLYLALLAPVTARLENGCTSDADRIVSLNKPPRVSQLARVIEACISGTSSWRRRAADRPAPIPRFAGRVLLVEDNPVKGERRFDGAIVDRAVLERIRELGGADKPDLLSRVLHLFLQDVPRHMAAIQRAWLQRDAPLLAASAHALKSSSAHIGAMRLSAMCGALENEAQASQLGRAESLVASLEGEWSAVRSEIESAMAELVG